jgi:uncharacterized membrane protein
VALPGLLTHPLIPVTLAREGDTALLTGCVLTLIGFGFSLYLMYREFVNIHAICSWCVSSAIVFAVRAVVQTVRMLVAGPPVRSRAPRIA